MTEPSQWWLVVGGFLVLGPLWGVLGTVVGMVWAIYALEPSSPRLDQAITGVSAAFYATTAGFVVFPIGIVIVVFYAVRCSRARCDAPRE